ncbi:MAG: YdcH family protein [Bryobacteraceae bacterium]|nr:YdcH family protein [Bryobacterales bacterium]MEB2360545.1 YdcH family protein [Bryobacterales bacterium]NUM99667.1 YdcH family protein [Bryobacteraceae bacterium]
MEQYQEEIKAHLMATDEEFRRLATKHSEYKKRVEELESRPHLSDEDHMEEVRLKKIKLHLKDQMLEMISRYRTQQTV